MCTTTTTVPTLKRTLETTSPEPQSKKPANEPFDLYPLFATIVNSLAPEIGQQPLPLNDTVDLLAQDTDVLFPFGQETIGKIRSQFDLFLNMGEENAQLKSDVHKVLIGLYQISLVNSSTKISLEHTSRCLPSLRDSAKPSSKDQILQWVQTANTLLQSEEKWDSPQLKQQMQTEIDRAIHHLQPFLNLKQHLDPVENQRLLDLARLYRLQSAPTQYPLIISDYPAIVHQATALIGDLNLASETVGKLVAAKLKLQKTQVQKTGGPEPTNSLKVRFLDAYGTSMYDAFAWHFWALTWNSKHIPEIGKLLRQIPGWRNASMEQVDHSLLNAVWEKLLPNSDLSDWILKSLVSLDPMALNELESKLAALSKSLNETRESKVLGKEDKEQVVNKIKQEMYQVCLEATEPEFSTLAKLKLFLS